MSPAWTLRTGRLLLVPIAWTDLADITALKADPRVFAVMLGGVRTQVQAAEELAADMAFWAARGYGIWSVRDAATGAFQGLTGLMEREDGRGVALRFALWPAARGRGLAREAAGAALMFGHETAGLARIVAVARDDNVASRTVLGGIGMTERERFLRDGVAMVLYESRRPGPPGAPAGSAG
ncbi:MAG: GNAT family N-acetyltransferase [Rhodospirillales bacterium]|jgi:RimJ/RimL family protein N-acetyltransferase|nr:GNAT family N-acetyltransferase [Rhodospirillales bacterium]